MTPTPRADTTQEASEVQFDALRAMGVEGRARLTFALIDNATELAIAGIRFREPNIDAARERWLLMSRRYGSDLACAVLGDEPSRR